MSEELKPCPFCGAPAKIVINRKEKYKMIPDYIYTSACSMCGANIPWELTEKEAIAAWNRRA